MGESGNAGIRKEDSTFQHVRCFLKENCLGSNADSCTYVTLDELIHLSESMCSSETRNNKTIKAPTLPGM